MRALLATIDVSFAASSISEAAGNAATTGTVTRTGAADITGALTINLSTLDATEISFPATVTIAANQTSANFNIDSVNDGDLDGLQTVTLTAQSTGFDPGQANIDVTDDDAPGALTVGGKLTGTIAAGEYQVIQDLIVPAGKTLTIAAGTTFKFAPGRKLLVQGLLTAVGTAAQPIAFTSAAATPAAGDWTGISFDSSGQGRSTLSYINVQFAQTGITISPTTSGTSQATISHADISHSSSHGVNLANGSGRFAGTSDVVISGSRIHDNGGKGIAVSAFSSGVNNSSASPTIQNNEIDHNGLAGIDLTASASTSTYSIPRSSSSVSPKVLANRIHDNGGAGISGYSGRFYYEQNSTGVAPLVQNNVIAGNQGDGIHFDSASSYAVLNPQIVANTVTGNAGIGVFHGQYAGTSLVIRSNLIAGNGGGIKASVAGFVPAAGAVGYNDVFNNAGSDWQNYPAAFGNLTGANVNGTPADAEFNVSIDPQFVSIGNHHIAPGSPLVNAGVAYSGLTTDFDGDQRIGAPEIGADEVWYLQFSLSASAATEGTPDGTVVATVSRTSTDLSNDVIVAIVNPDPMVFNLPATVTIPAGFAQVQFAVNLLDDAAIEAAQNRTLGVQAAGFVSASAAFTVVDDEVLPAAPPGPEFRVNADPAPADSEPLIARQPNGGYLVVWKTVRSSVVYFVGQRFDQNDQPIGGEIPIATLTGVVSNGEEQARLATDAQGNFTVAWMDKTADANNFAVFTIYARRFQADGTPAGDAWVVKTGSQQLVYPEVAMHADGRFSVLWKQNTTGPFIQQYAADGSPVGTETTLDAGSTDYRPAAAYDAAGNIVVAWMRSGSFRSDVYLKRYDASADAWGAAQLVNNQSQSDYYHLLPAIGFDAQGMATVAWHGRSGGYWDRWVWVRKYDGNGNPTGPAYVASGNLSSTEYAPALGVDAAGNFAIGWMTYGVSDTYVQQFYAQGIPRTTAQLPSTVTTGNQHRSQMIMDEAGNFVIVWEGNGPGDSQGIFARRFVVPTPTLAVDIPAQTTENAGIAALTGTVTRSGVNMNAPLTVQLASSDSSELVVPVSVTIPAGQPSATFSIDVPNDNLDDGTQPATVTVSAAQYVSGQDQIQVLDNDAPVIGGVPATGTYTENATPLLVAPTGTVTDENSPNFAGGVLTVQIAANGQADDRLGIRNQGTAAGQISISLTDPATNTGNVFHTVLVGGVLTTIQIGTFTGGIGTTPLTISLNAEAKPLKTQALLRNLTYSNVSENPATAARAVSLQLTDGDGGTSLPVVRQVSVKRVNDNPVVGPLGGDLTFKENGAPLLLSTTATVSDVDSTNFAGGALTVDFAANAGTGDVLSVRDQGTASNQIHVASGQVYYGPTLIGTVSGGDGAPLVVNLTAGATPGRTQALLRNVTYQNTSDNPSAATRSVRVQLTDGDGGTSDLVTRLIAVTPVNDAPTIGSFGGDVTYTGMAIALSSAATVSDPDSADFATGRLVVKFNSGAEGADRLEIAAGGNITVNTLTKEISWSGTLIGTYTGGSGLTALTINFNADATAPKVQDLLRAITYRSTSSTPSTGPRTVQAQLFDGDGGTSLAVTKQIIVSTPSLAEVDAAFAAYASG